MFRNRHTSRMVAMVACISVLGGSMALSSPLFAQDQGKNPPKTKKTPKPKQPPGGANQVTGLQGKIGDMLFDGRWRFQVQDVQEVSTYTLTVLSSEQDYGRFRDVANQDFATKTFTPREGYKLIAVKCLAKNGQKSVQQLDGYAPDLKTALTDDQGNSYPPIAYDMQTSGAWTTKKLLPGSSQMMTILFAVPPETKLKDLVFSLKNWSDRKVNNLRISLAPKAETTPAEGTP